MTTGLWDRETFLENLRAIGARAYHDKHPFHVAMNEGRLSPEALRGWVANRFYYQRNIPIKDAAILSNCRCAKCAESGFIAFSITMATAENEGGIEAWLRLGEACGLSRDELMQDRHLQPGVRFAVDAYVNFARTQPWPIAIASSLTELFAPDLMAARLAAFEKFYPWIDPRGLDYFRRRVTQARRDSDEALAITLEHCNTPRAAARGRARARVQMRCALVHPRCDSSCLRFFLNANCPRSLALPPRLARGVRLQTDSATGNKRFALPRRHPRIKRDRAGNSYRCDGRTTELKSSRRWPKNTISILQRLATDVRETLADLQHRKLIELT